MGEPRADHDMPASRVCLAAPPAPSMYTSSASAPASPGVSAGLNAGVATLGVKTAAGTLHGSAAAAVIVNGIV